MIDDDNKDASSRILAEADEKHVEQPGEAQPSGIPAGKSQGDAAVDGSDRVNPDG